MQYKLYTTAARLVAHVRNANNTLRTSLAVNGCLHGTASLAAERTVGTHTKHPTCRCCRWIVRLFYTWPLVKQHYKETIKCKSFHKALTLAVFSVLKLRQCSRQRQWDSSCRLGVSPCIAIYTALQLRHGLVGSDQSLERDRCGTSGHSFHNKIWLL